MIGDMRALLSVLLSCVMLVPVKAQLAGVNQPAYPLPHYIPPGFSFRQQVAKPPTGFGGDPELQLIYSKPGTDPHTHRNLPLLFFVGLNPTKPLMGTRDAPPEHVTHATITTNSGVSVDGQYYDGFWVPDPNGYVTRGGLRFQWDTTDIHTITFTFRGFSIGIQGARSKDVGKDELLKIAASVQ
jgi:hypothetical protein